MADTVAVTERQTVREGRIPSSAEDDSFWSERNQARLMESLQQAESGLLTEHELIEVD